MLLGNMVCQFGQGFGRPNAYANRNTGPRDDTLTHMVTRLFQVWHAREIDKALIDGIDLMPWRVVTQNRHHPVGHVGIERVVRTQSQDAVFLR